MKKKQASTGKPVYTKFGIGYRLVAAFSAVTLLTVLISIFGWFSLDVLTNAQDKTAKHDIPSIALALKLANDATEISAIAPRLGSVSSDQERQQVVVTLNAAIAQANSRLGELNGFIEDNDSLRAISQNLLQLEPLLENLDGSVKGRLYFAELRKEKLKQLEEFRSILDKGIGSLLFPTRMKLFNAADGWEELLEESIETALTGKQPEYDTEPLKQAATEAMTGQEAVFRVQSSGYLLISLLAEGALAENPETVEKLMTQFLSSISSMATPLSKIGTEKNKKFVAKFDELFENLLTIGSRGSDEEVIFTIRIRELGAAKNAEEILAKSRDLAETLTKNVNAFVASIESDIQQVNEENHVLAENTKVSLAVAALISVLVAIAIAWFYIARNIVKRLLMMVDSARKLSEGDLESSIYREGNDEIARLGFAIVGFRDSAREAKAARIQEEQERVRREAEKEQQRQEQIENDRRLNEEKERLTEEAEAKKVEELNRLADEFEGSVKHLVESFSAATTDMNTISGSMSGSAEQTSSLTQTVASASQISSSSINAVASAAEELTSSISEISQQVGQAASIAGDAVTEAERSNVMITSLNEAAAKIGDVVELISDIAEQTNLLALNATIEAARAGDAGKGFAVVASEVKNLATQTAKATEEITSQIKSVQQETGNAVLAIGGISSTISRISEINTTISAAVEEQGAATNEISRSVQKAADSANEVSENINTVNETASKTGSSATEVQGVAQKLAQEAGNLQEEVDRFLKQVRAG
ncbi:methyl-accepting chemotaxis protein [Sneathiella aquimaris]|uniref:methyl-accepting chemotaxis protein n=1 Tax=Sneathiella aquimaris TaxID=2599305 RepID=UPI00146E9277|nr:methyl-accepting chemotaxis protein [Sneathiella aquimaris]